ncbi:MAG: exosortase X, partial [Mucilaginibacter sp.]
MFSFNFNNKITRFLVLAAALYVSWYVLYELVIKPFTNIDELLVGFIINNAAFVLKIMGFVIYQNREDQDLQLLGVDGAHPVWIGAPCNALTLFAFFTFFVIAFPGNNKNKWWFILLGIVIIHVANILRVMGLVLINYYAPQYLEFNHTYTFTIIVYSLIFALWMKWVTVTLEKNKRNE